MKITKRSFASFESSLKLACVIPVEFMVSRTLSSERFLFLVWFPGDCGETLAVRDLISLLVTSAETHPQLSCRWLCSACHRRGNGFRFHWPSGRALCLVVV